MGLGKLDEASSIFCDAASSGGKVSFAIGTLRPEVRGHFQEERVTFATLSQPRAVYSFMSIAPCFRKDWTEDAG